MIDRYKMACLVFAAVAVLAILFPTTSYGEALWSKDGDAVGEVLCKEAKDKAKNTFAMAVKVLKELVGYAKSQKKRRVFILCQCIATLYPTPLTMPLFMTYSAKPSAPS